MRELILEAGRAERHYWRDLWRYRELFYTLVWRDLAVRYKQTAIGVSWALIRPLLTMVVFTVVFGKLAKLPAPAGVPYALLVFAAMLPWQFVATGVSEASASLIGNASLISKVYFPRLIVPAASVLTSFTDFLVSFVILLGLMAWYQYPPDWRILTLPLFIVLAVGAVSGMGVWLCALNVKYRDVRYVVPFVVQVGLYISPVGFSSVVVPAEWRLFYNLNPMVGVIEGVRWAVLRGSTPLDPLAVLMSVVTVALVLASSLWYFRNTEKSFADVI